MEKVKSVTIGNQTVGGDGKLFVMAGPCVIEDPDRICLLYTSPSPRDRQKSRMPSSA